MLRGVGRARVLRPRLVFFGLGHFSPRTSAYAASLGVPLATMAVPFSGVLAVAGGLSVLVGYRARIAAGLLLLFLVPVTVMMHAFWAAPSGQLGIRWRRRWQLAMFMKNGSMLGGALVIAYFGAGAGDLGRADDGATHPGHIGRSLTDRLGRAVQPLDKMLPGCLPGWACYWSPLRAG